MFLDVQIFLPHFLLLALYKVCDKDVIDLQERWEHNFCLIYPLLRKLDTASDDAESITGERKCTWLGRFGLRSCLRVGLGRFPSVCRPVERGSSSQLKCFRLLPWVRRDGGGDG